MNGHIDLHDENIHFDAERAHRVARIGAILVVLLVLAGLILAVNPVPEPSADMAGAGATFPDIDRHAQDGVLANEDGTTWRLAM